MEQGTFFILKEEVAMSPYRGSGTKAEAGKEIIPERIGIITTAEERMPHVSYKGDFIPITCFKETDRPSDAYLLRMIEEKHQRTGGRRMTVLW